MAFNHSKVTVVFLDNAAGALQNISAFCSSASLNTEIEEIETTTFGATDRTYLTGFADASLSLEGFWDPVLATHMQDLINAFRTEAILSATFEYGPAGNLTGKPKFSGEAILTSYEKSNDIGDATTWTAELRVTGPVIVGTF